jgi:hypothetical protein
MSQFGVWAYNFFKYYVREIPPVKNQCGAISHAIRYVPRDLVNKIGAGATFVSYMRCRQHEISTIHEKKAVGK